MFQNVQHTPRHVPRIKEEFPIKFTYRISCLAYYITFISIFECLVAQGHKGVTVTRRLWVRFPIEGMNYYLLIFSFLRLGTEAQIPALSSATQHGTLKKSAESGERSVLTLDFLLTGEPSVLKLGSLCLPFCLWGTA